MPSRFGSALVLFATLHASQLPPQPQRGTGLVVGQVVDAGSGRPVAGAIVTLGASGPGAQGPRVLTGSDGRFVFRDLRRGEYPITAIKPGFADGAHGRTRAGGPAVPLSLNENDRVGDVVIRLWKHASISGTVVDESGERLVAVPVRAYRRTVVGGRRRYVASTITTTDDRGIFRIGSLIPGDYIVSTVARQVSVPLSMYRNRVPGAPERNVLAEVGMVGPTDGPGVGVLETGNGGIVLGRGSQVLPPGPDGRLFVYPPTFHPSTTAGGAGAVITVRPGEEYLNADLQLTPVPTATVSGYVFGPDGPVTKAALRLVPANTTELASELDLPTTVTDTGGAFIFPAVPSGHYTVRMNRPGIPIQGAPTSGPIWLDAPLSVGIQDIEGLTLTATTGLRVSGRLDFEGDLSRARTSASRVQIAIEPADIIPGTATYFAWPGANGEFTSQPIPPGRYYVRVPNSPAGWMFKSATIDGRDVADVPFNLVQDATQVAITFTDRWSGVRGSVQGLGGRDSAAMVLIFPTDRDAWGSAGLNPRRVRSTRASKSGEYSFNLPPGEYFVVAIPEEHSAEWQDPDFLEAISGSASRVNIGEGERRIQDLRTRELR